MDLWAILLLALISGAMAKTDLTGCTSSDVSSPAGASVIWYVESNGELCSFLDCGGGTAPPKTTVPGCPLYSGTATYSPSYLPGFNAGAASTPATSTSFEAATTTAPSTVMITGSLTAETESTFVSSASTTESASTSVTFLSGTVSESASVSTSRIGSTSASITSKLSTTTQSKSASGASTSTGTAAAASSTGNVGAIPSVNVLAPGLVGAMAASFAFFL